MAASLAMKLHQKLLLGFACVALLVSCVGYVAQQVNRNVERSVRQLSEVAVGELAAAADLQAALREALDAAGRATVLHGAEREAAREGLAEALARFEAAHAAARSATATGRSRAAGWGRRDVVALQDQKLGWLATAQHAFHALRVELERSADGAYRGGGDASRAALQQALERYRGAARATVEAEVAAVQGQLLRADRLLFGAVLLGIGLTLVLGVLVAHAITSPLAVLAEAARAFGRGGFEHRVRLRAAAEVAALGEALNRMAEELGRTTVSKEYLDAVLRTMADPLLVVGLDGRVLLANDAAEAALGYLRAELEGAPLARFLAEGEADARRVLDEAERSGFSGNLELALRTREGAELPVAFSGAVMRGPEGTPQGVVCVAKDITAQKLVERELQAARERAEQMARMKASFLANMSHEIRTPLTGIIGSAQVLAEQAEGEALEIAGIIERAGVRLLATVNSVLDMARIEAGEMRPAVEPVLLAEEVHDAVAVIRRVAEGKGLALEVVERGEVWAAADPGFLHRIVTNLVGNAVKFTRQGGVTVEVAAEGEEAVLRVIDTGIGISEAFLPHLFEEFQQESSGLHRTHEGSGLGLAITRRLVALLGGSIAVESTPGLGTTFTVRLPRAAAPVPAPVRA